MPPSSTTVISTPWQPERCPYCLGDRASCACLEKVTGTPLTELDLDRAIAIDRERLERLQDDAHRYSPLTPGEIRALWLILSVAVLAGTSLGMLLWR